MHKLNQIVGKKSDKTSDKGISYSIIELACILKYVKVISVCVGGGVKNYSRLNESKREMMTKDNE